MKEMKGHKKVKFMGQTVTEKSITISGIAGHKHSCKKHHRRHHEKEDD